MKKIIRLTERDLIRMVKRVIKEEIIVTDEDFPFPDDPNEIDKWHVEEIFKVDRARFLYIKNAEGLSK